MFFYRVFFLVYFYIFVRFLYRNVVRFLPSSLFILVVSVVRVSFFHGEVVLVLGRFKYYNSFFFCFPSFLVFRCFFPSFFSFLDRVRGTIVAIAVPLEV